MQTSEITNSEQILPPILDDRWKYIKSQIHKLAQFHDKYELIKQLLEIRENFTAAPTLNEITNFTGHDVAIHTIQRWNWNKKEETRSLTADATEIGKFGAELMVLHTIQESIKNNLLIYKNDELVETDIGKKHFDQVNSFNVEITGSRMDIARKRYSQERLTKSQRKMDPLNKLISVKRLYLENSVLMLLRAPLAFYRAMQILTPAEQKALTEIQGKLVNRLNSSHTGLLTVRLKKNSKTEKIFQKLTPPDDNNDRRPRFVACLEKKEKLSQNKTEYFVGIGALSMFTMFIMGFEKENLDEKAKRAENAVREVINNADYWDIVECNREIIHEGGEVITEIDIIAKSFKDKENWITIEVKDFSFWRGWIYGAGIQLRRNYYKKAVDKLPIKEDYIKSKYEISNLNSIIVTSVPEPFDEINNVSIVYVSDLMEELMKLIGQKFSSRKKHQSTNFLIRYYTRLVKDYEVVKKISEPSILLEKELKQLQNEKIQIKNEYEKILENYNRLKSEYETLKISEKLSTKRLLKDNGERHYQIEEELNIIKSNIEKLRREKSLRASFLKKYKVKYNSINELLKEKEKDLERLYLSKDRNLSARIF